MNRNLLHAYHYITHQRWIQNNLLHSNYDQQTLKEVRKLVGLEHKLVRLIGTNIFIFVVYMKRSSQMAVELNIKNNTYVG